MPKVREMPAIVLVRDEDARTLSRDEAEKVLAAFPAVRHEAIKWTRMFRRSGRLLLIDPAIVEEIAQYLWEKPE